MTLAKTLKNITLCATLLLSAGCSVYKQFVPEEQKPYTFPIKQPITSEEERRKENPLLHWHAGDQFDADDNLEEKIHPLDLPKFVKRTSTYFKKRVNEKVYDDLQETKLRDLAFVKNRRDYDMILRLGYPRTNNAGDIFEREFSTEVNQELQKVSTRALKDALQDIDAYEYVRPFFEFNLKKDKFPIVGRAFTSTTEQKEQPQPDPRAGTDEFDQRVTDPYKIPEQSLAKKFVLDRLSDVSIGINMDFDVVRVKTGFGLKPYVKWMDLFRWTYSSKDRTIEHKFAFTIDSIGIGFSAETNETCTRLNYLNFSVNYAITPDCMIGIGAYQQFYDVANEVEKRDIGGSFGFFARF